MQELYGFGACSRRLSGEDEYLQHIGSHRKLAAWGRTLAATVVKVTTFY